MAGVVDQGGHRLPLRAGDAGGDEGVVAGPAVGVEAADEVSPLGVPVVPVGAHLAPPAGVGDRGRPEGGHGLPGGHAQAGRQLLQVGVDQVASGETAAVGQEPAGGVAVGVGDDGVLARRPAPRERPPQGLVPDVGQAHQVEVGPHQQPGRRRRVEGGQDEHVGHQRAVDARRPVVAGERPHAVVDPHRRGDVPPRACPTRRLEGGGENGLVLMTGHGSPPVPAVVTSCRPCPRLRPTRPAPPPPPPPAWCPPRPPSGSSIPGARTARSRSAHPRRLRRRRAPSTAPPRPTCPRTWERSRPCWCAAACASPSAP